MSEQEVLDLINNFIVANGNNEITADVLNPILEEMVKQPNILIGILSQLQTSDQTNLVNAINEVYSMVGDITDSGVKVYQGTSDPNTTPPPTFNVADFYHQVNNLNQSIALWQYNGISWVELGAGTVTSVTGVADQITVANGTTTPVIGISSVFANSKANLSGGNYFTGVQNFANDIKLPVNSSVVLGEKFRWVYRSDLNGFSLTTEDVETGTIFIKDTDAKIGLHNTNPQSALDVVGSVRASANDGNANTLTRNDDVVLRGGTLPDKPITGPLRFSDTNNVYVFGDDNGVEVGYEDEMDSAYYYVNPNSSGFNVNKDSGDGLKGYSFQIQPALKAVTLESDDSEFKGLVGNTLFNKQNDPNAYAQIGDVNSGIVTSDPLLTFATNELRQNHFVTFNGTASTLNLPLASENAWKCITVWNKGTSDVTVNAGTNEIWEGGIEMGTTTISVDSNTKFVSDGLNWNIQ